MRPLIPALAALALALPAAAQPDPRPLDRMAEAFADEILRQMFGDLAPTLRDLERLMDEVERYGAPVLLPNGDILIPRKPDAPEPTGPEEQPSPGEAIEL
jgi:hypothetical protein